jgi:hypothetical protein
MTFQWSPDAEEAGLFHAVGDRASATWEDLVYNLARPLKILRLGAHTSGWVLATVLTGSGGWTVNELLWTSTLPFNT